MLRLSQALGNVTVVQKGEQDMISDGEQGEWPQTSHRVSVGTAMLGTSPRRTACPHLRKPGFVLFLGVLHREVVSMGHAGSGWPQRGG